MVIAIDAMGGDYGHEVTVPASINALSIHPNLRLVLVGEESILTSALARYPSNVTARIRVHHASQAVTMDESPSQALRNKKDSSMRVAINLVKEKTVQACVSAGNTGALMAIARFVLKMLPGIDRPAIITTFPTLKGDKQVRILDLGANVDSYADHLYQFAVMGSVLVSQLEGIERPRIGLLNIGQEEIKGNDQVKQTALLLTNSKSIHYYGYIEGDKIFSGEVDVVVCDGFVGNVALKTMEGLMRLIVGFAREEFKRNWFSKLVALISSPVLKRLKQRLDPGRRNGATLIGLQGIVIKSHGGANVMAFTQAIHEAMIQVEHDIPQKIGQEVGLMLEENT